MTNRLTPYEERICKLRLGGLTHWEIAEATGRSHGTVRNDFSRIYQKLGIKESGQREERRQGCALGPAFTEYQIKKEETSLNTREIMNIIRTEAL